MAPRLQDPTRLAFCIGCLAAGFALHGGVAQTADAPKSTTRVITLRATPCASAAEPVSTGAAEITSRTR